MNSPDITKKIEAILARVQLYENIVILGHTNPDADAIGSAQTLAIGLRKKYPQKTFYTPFRLTNPNLNVLKPVNSDISKLDWTEALVILVDCHQLERTDYQKYSPKEIVAIDHHEGSLPANVTTGWLDPNRVACAEMIFDFLKFIGAEKEPAIFPFIYGGIVTDSGSFNYKNVTSHTLAVVGSFIDQIDYQALAFGLFARHREEIKGQIYVWSNIKWENQFLIFQYLPEDQCKFPVKDAYQFIQNYLKTFDNFVDLKIYSFFVQIEENGPIVVEMRSRGNLNVGELAVKYGGGGHVNAAGVTLHSLKRANQLKSDLQNLIKN